MRVYDLINRDVRAFGRDEITTTKYATNIDYEEHPRIDEVADLIFYDLRPYFGVGVSNSLRRPKLATDAKNGTWVAIWNEYDESIRCVPAHIEIADDEE